MSRLENDTERVRVLTAGIAELDQARDLLTKERLELLQSLRANGVTLRALAKLSGMSFQRCHQIVS